MMPIVPPAPDTEAPAAEPPVEAVPRQLPAAAARALAEAAERRRRAMSEAKPSPPEHGGRDGPDPVRYGDWEKGGIASDF